MPSRTARTRGARRGLERRGPLRLFLLAVFVGLIAVSCSYCAKPSTRPHTVYDVLGFTIWPCDAPAPRFFISEAAYRDRRTFNSVVAHERSHKLFMMSFKSCEDWSRWRSVLENRYQLEALAYCASARSLVDDGVNADSALDAAARALASPFYGFGVSVERARAKIVGVCP